MYRSTHVYVKCLVSYLFFMAIQRVNGAWHAPALRRDGVVPERRQSCSTPSPNVDQNAADDYHPCCCDPKLFTQICYANPQNEFFTCYNKLAVYTQDSANTYCSRTWAVYNDCLILKGHDSSVCFDERLAFQACADYTLQTYAYCFCYYDMPDDLYHCANIIRQVRSPPAETPTTTIVPSISGASLAAPLVPSGAPTTAVSLTGLGSLPASLPTSPAFPPTSVASPTLIPPSPTFATTFANPGGLLVSNTYASPIPPSPTFPSTFINPGGLPVSNTYASPIPPSPTFPNTFINPGGLPVPSTYPTFITSPVVGIPSGTGIGSAICSRVTRTVRGIL